MELTACPECCAPAEIEWRLPVDSTHGPVDHVKVYCVRRHWFLMPSEEIAALAGVVPGAAHGTAS
ncbi:hypothetical protein [Blastococcus haudaquaticus]|uniref:Uncharacterized protein n=1 Tax=Blastococcus haudaquaticus TaxID=1938745 RepID=A0A286GT87_9ACTN|nr:hypothetical protein [Blastococcus haudaquaticus]SOD98748.1 hypothetical protein SAMN06272739_2018 [Blastococcus haudaquaticus]